VTGSERERIELEEQLAQNDLAQAETNRAAAAAEVVAARATLGRGVRGLTDFVPIVAPTGGKVLRVLREAR
jgi:hypothetical protein